jgi:hypothetical protein
MTDTAAEVPVMGFGVEQRQLWMQAATTLGSWVYQRRMAEGHPAWSEGRAAEREHARTRRQANPTARSMSAEERAAASAARQRSEGQERRVDSTDGWAKVGLRPLPAGRFGLLADGGSTRRTPTAVAAVSCTDPPPRSNWPRNCSTPTTRRRWPGCTGTRPSPRSAPPTPPATSSNPSTPGSNGRRRPCARCGPASTPTSPTWSTTARPSARWCSGWPNWRNAATPFPTCCGSSMRTGSTATPAIPQR